MFKKILYGLLALVLILVGYLALWPAPIDPVAWIPPEAPKLEGILAPNTLLNQSEVLGEGKVKGPEDVAVDSAGRIYSGSADGRITRILHDGQVETFANTGGRPLGLHFDAQGNLIVADAKKGLLSVSTSGEVTTLVAGYQGKNFVFADDLDIGPDGIIYFSDASDTYPIEVFLLDLLEARPHGRLYSYNPATRETRMLLDGLYFANGIAVSSRGDFVLVNETGRYQITRYWLKGPQAGSHDIFIENLPGFPYGISSNRRGTFWLALASPRKADVDQLHTNPFMKKVVTKLPDSMKPAATMYGFVLALDEQGNILRSYQDPSGKNVAEVTSVEEHGGYIYLGNLTHDRFWRLKLD